MSGESVKLVKVEEVALRVLSKKKKAVEANSAEITQQLQAIEQESRQNFQHQLAKLAKRTQTRKEQCTQLKSPLATLENQSLENLQEQQQKLQTILSVNPPGQSKPEYEKILQSQSQHFTQLYQQQQSITVKNNLQAEKQFSAKIAQDLMSDVQSIVLDIEHNYQHERFTPGRLSNLKRQVEMAQANLKAGLMEATIAGSQQTYLALADLRLELEQKEQEFLLLYNLGLESVRSSIVQAQASRHSQVAIGEGEQQENFNLDVDYWSNGRLSEHLAKLEQLKEQLIKEHQTLTNQKVQEINGAISQEQSQLEEIIEQARLAMLSSQMRAEIADMVVSSLSGLGYTLVNKLSSI